jgi:hypothetical protein
VTVVTSEASLGRPAAPARTRGTRAGGVALTALMLLLPFEPRALALPIAGLRVTILEGAAAVAMLALLSVGRHRAVSLLRRPPAPLVALWAYAAVHVVSAMATPYHPDLARKFAVRMVAMAAFATLVVALPPLARRRGLLALVAAALIVAALAIGEGLGLSALEPFLNLFRETPFNVAGARRATAGSEYPNLAAAFMMYGLLAGVGLAAAAGRRAPALLLAFVLSCGLAFTYSRGALVAALAGLVALAAREALRDRRALWIPAASAALVLVTSAAFLLSGEVFRLRLEGEGMGRWYGATYDPADDTLRLSPGERRQTTVRVRNTGRKTWSRHEAFHLSYHLMKVGGPTTVDGLRTVLPDEVKPGDVAVARAEIRAPAEPGEYMLIWDLVHEHTTWFSGQGVAPAVVPLLVGDGAAGLERRRAPVPADLAGPMVWKPGRAELWRLAVGLWRERPLLGVGSDNYRHLYGARAGHSYWDHRVYANHTLLEAAATAGLLGAAALGASLLLTLWWTFRARGPESAALFAVAVGIASHGMVDYMLAATGHYLLFGFVVGAAAASRDDP